MRERLVVLNETDQALAEIFKFNQELAEFDKTLTACQAWVDGKAKEKLDAIRKPQGMILLIGNLISLLIIFKIPFWLLIQRRNVGKFWRSRRIC